MSRGGSGDRSATLDAGDRVSHSVDWFASSYVDFVQRNCLVRHSLGNFANRVSCDDSRVLKTGEVRPKTGGQEVASSNAPARQESPGSDSRIGGVTLPSRSVFFKAEDGARPRAGETRGSPAQALVVLPHGRRDVRHHARQCLGRRNALLEHVFEPSDLIGPYLWKGSNYRT